MLITLLGTRASIIGSLIERLSIVSFEALVLGRRSQKFCLSNSHPTMVGGHMHMDHIDNLKNMANTMEERFSWVEQTLQNLTILMQ